MKCYFSVGVLLILIATTASAGVEELEHRLVVSDEAFRSGELVGITYEVCNTSDDLIILAFDGAPWGPWTLDVINENDEEVASYDDGIAYPLVPAYFHLEWQSGECQAQVETTWHQRIYDNFGPTTYFTYGPQAPAGIYRFQISWHSLNETLFTFDSAEFEILPSPIVEPGLER